MSTNAIDAFRSKPIELTAAVRGHLRFRKFQKIAEATGEPDERLFGHAICFSIAALRTILDEAETYLAGEGIDEEQRGLALYNIINDNDPSRIPLNLRNRPSIMLVGSQVDPLDDSGKVNFIKNVIEDEINNLDPRHLANPEAIIKSDLKDPDIKTYANNYFDVGNKHP